MFGSTWATTPLWLSRSLRPFLYNYSVYSCYFFLISSVSLVSPILEEISSLSHSIVFLCHFALFTLLAILWNSVSCTYLSFSPLSFTSVLFSAIYKAFSDNHIAFLHFFLLGDGFDHQLPTPSHHFMGNRWGNSGNNGWLYLGAGAPKSLQMVIAAMKLKDAYSLEGKLRPT